MCMSYYMTSDSCEASIYGKIRAQGSTTLLYTVNIHKC